MDKNELLVKELVKLQVLCARYVGRNTTLSCITFRDLDRIVQGGKLTTTYLGAVTNLRKNIEKYCNKNEYLLNSVLQLEKNIKESTIKDLRFGIEPQKKFTELEQNLDMFFLRCQLFYTGEMVGIKYIVENLKLTESAVKQACQQERLLNTKKIGRNWMVHIPECRAYWNIPDTDQKHLYKGWEY